jgi:hypothetical protein
MAGCCPRRAALASPGLARETGLLRKILTRDEESLASTEVAVATCPCWRHTAVELCGRVSNRLCTCDARASLIATHLRHHMSSTVADANHSVQRIRLHQKEAVTRNRDHIRE